MAGQHRSLIMKKSSHLQYAVRSLTLGVLVSLGLATSACTSDVDQGSVSESGDELKGGIPANGKVKSNKGKHLGQAGSVSVDDDDAGLPGMGKGKGKDKDKVKKPKKVKADKDAGADEDGDLDEGVDEDTAIDEDTTDEQPA
jgi:hypothetical protein